MPDDTVIQKENDRNQPRQRRAGEKHAIKDTHLCHLLSTNLKPW
jgi:hypothetical protein